jgi:tetratricopeptide (TPR) repeat protein
VILAGLTLAVYARVAAFDFIGFDDPTYVTENPHVIAGLTLDGLRWAVTTFHAANWHPLTWVSHMADVELWGLWPGGHHLTSLLLHVGTTLLLFAALERLTGAPGRSFVVAGLFALHPTRVESVAWVSERKDVLSALLWFATVGAWLAWVRTGTRTRYAAAVGLYALGLVAKPMLVTLPFTLLLLDHWPLERLRTHTVGRLIVEKLPFLALAATVATLTVAAQTTGNAVVTLAALPLGARIANAAVAYVTYVGLLAWPSGLAFFYPLVPVTTARAVAAAVALLAVTTACGWQVRRRPYLLVGWLWFVGTLVPVIGLVQVGQQALADRYTYVPAVGLFVAVVWGASEWFATMRVPQRLAAGIAAAILLLAATGSAVQVGFWRDDETLFARALAVTRNNFVAHMNLGRLATRQANPVAAEQHYRAAAEIQPALAEAHLNLGNAVMAQNRDVEARAHLERAVTLAPHLAEAHNTLGLLAARAGDPTRARASFERALAIRPRYGEAHANLADLLARTGDRPAALSHYRQALATMPAAADVHLSLGLVLLSSGDAPGAVVPLRTAFTLAPDDADAANALGTALLLVGNPAGALETLTAAVALRPTWAEAHHHRGAALGTMGRVEEALAEFERAVALDPRLLEAYRSAATTLERAGQRDEAQSWRMRGAEQARALGESALPDQPESDAARVDTSGHR